MSSLPKSCGHCFKDIIENEVQCDGCKLFLHPTCLNVADEELQVILNLRSQNIKIFCNHCNFTITLIGNIKSKIDDMQKLFDNRFDQLEAQINAVKSPDGSRLSTVNPEESIDESVERSIRASNVIVYNVEESVEKSDVEVANDILEAIDPVLVVAPDNVLRVGKKTDGRPRLLKLRFKSADLARLCLRKKTVLRSHKNFSHVNIKDDKTPRQINYLKSLRTELKNREDAGEKNLTIKYVNHVPTIVTKN